MASSYFPATGSCFNSTIGDCSNRNLNLINNGFHYYPATRFPSSKLQGAVLCSQCKGNGVNAVDFFNGQFKGGASCWLCSGKKEMLCGNCNRAVFVGGFLSTYDQ